MEFWVFFIKTITICGLLQKWLFSGATDPFQGSQYLFTYYRPSLCLAARPSLLLALRSFLSPFQGQQTLFRVDRSTFQQFPFNQNQDLIMAGWAWSFDHPLGSFLRQQTFSRLARFGILDSPFSGWSAFWGPVGLFSRQNSPFRAKEPFSWPTWRCKSVVRTLAFQNW